MKILKTNLLIAMFLLVSGTAIAQYKAVLVMLKSESNRISYFEKRGKKAEAEEVRADAENIMQVTINDFTDHFTSCPVYYFMDTNLKYIKEKKFNGVLLDKNRKTLGTTVMRPADESSFLIVYYGTPTDDVEQEKNGELKYRATRYPGKGLVILGHDFKRIPNSKFYLYTPEITGLGLFGKLPKKYNYYSKKYDMLYTQKAEKFQEEFIEKK